MFQARVINYTLLKSDLLMTNDDIQSTQSLLFHRYRIGHRQWLNSNP